MTTHCLRKDLWGSRNTKREDLVLITIVPNGNMQVLPVQGSYVSMGIVYGGHPLILFEK